MSNSQEDKFADRIAEIYKEIEPSLFSMARRLKASNPEQVVKGWMSRAYEIVDRFDKGELKAKVYKEPDNHDEMESYNPDKHDRERFETALKNYLKQCFVRDILKDYNKRKRRKEAQVDENLVDATTSRFSILHHSAHLL